MRSKKQPHPLALLALVASASLPAAAALTFELHTAGLTGRSITIPTTGGSYQVELYANITDSPQTEGLAFTTLNLFSRPLVGGVATGGGVAAFQLDSLGQRNLALVESGAKHGANPLPGDAVPTYTQDGVADWGTAETFATFLSSNPTNPGSRAKFNRSISYLATDGSQTATALYTLGNRILVGTFTINFLATDLRQSPEPGSRTRFQVDLARRANVNAPGTTQWIENVATPASAPPAETSGRFRSPTISATLGPDGTQHNIGFTDSPLAYIDFKLPGSSPPTYIQLVSDASTINDLPFLAFAHITVSGNTSTSVETLLAGQTKGYVEILTNNQNLPPGIPTFVALDLLHDLLPENLTVAGGTDVTSTLLDTVQANWGSEYDAVLRFDHVGPDIAFDFSTVGVNAIVAFLPEPTSLALLALPAATLLRRRT